jgi:hypothetical protein
MTDSPATCCRPEALRAFRAALPGLATTRGLVDATVAIAQHELPMASGADVWARLCAIAARIRSRVRAPNAAALLAHAHDELFVVEGFTGDRLDYHAPENSYLPRVLARRRGLPIALVLVYKVVLGELGIEVAGIAAPGHFLAQVLIEGAPAYVDPFHGGRGAGALRAGHRPATAARRRHAAGVRPGDVVAAVFAQSRGFVWLAAAPARRARDAGTAPRARPPRRLSRLPAAFTCRRRLTATVA